MLLSKKYSSEVLKLTKNTLDLIDILYDIRMQHTKNPLVRFYPPIKHRNYVITTFDGANIVMHEKQDNADITLHKTELIVEELITLCTALEEKKYEK